MKTTTALRMSKKAIGFDKSLHDCDMKMPNFMSYGGKK